jgi:hypothetical protein
VKFRSGPGDGVQEGHFKKAKPDETDRERENELVRGMKTVSEQ